MPRWVWYILLGATIVVTITISRTWKTGVVQGGCGA